MRGDHILAKRLRPRWRTRKSRTKRTTKAVMLAMSSIVTVASAKPVSGWRLPGCIAATVAVAALPITAPNQAGSSSAAGGRTNSGDRPSESVLTVSSIDFTPQRAQPICGVHLGRAQRGRVGAGGGAGGITADPPPPTAQTRQ